MSELNIEEIPGILDSIENRCMMLRILIPMVKHQPEFEKCVATLLEDNYLDCQTLVDFCVIKED